MDNDITLGIIGGSGLYNIPSLTNKTEFSIETPFGSPSSKILTGTINNQKVAFLTRHGPGHIIPPSKINYRANIYALKLAGVKRIISVSAVGSLKENLAPGHIVIPDGLYDNTSNRIKTFFNDDIVAHVDVADPFCKQLSSMLANAVKPTGANLHEGGSFITIEGPRFSTKTESNTFRSWDMSIIGMTTSPEAFLAREAEICYSVMAHVTDYDVWHESETPVTVDMVIKTLQENTDIATSSLENLAKTLSETPDQTCKCHTALSDAIITKINKTTNTNTHNKLRLLIDKYIQDSFE